jgi:hypothetical protein
MQNSLVNTLMELKRRSDLAGRPMAASEAEGAASGYFSKKAAQNLEEKQLALQEQGLAQNASQFQQSLVQQQSNFAAQLAAAKRARTQGWINTGVGAGLAGGALYYL